MCHIKKLMNKGIIIGIAIVIIAIGILASVDFSEFSTNEIEPVPEVPVNDDSSVEETVTPEGKSVKVNLSDGIGAGER